MSLATSALSKSSRIASFLRRLHNNQAGNTFLILGAGIFPILGMIGGAVDIGRQYMTQARLQVACDAGALAARRVMANPAVLTSSDQATGNRFFDFNFPTGSFGTTALTRSYVKGSADGVVDGTASAIVPTTVMSVFGLEQSTVSVVCKSTLNVPNSDVMFVLDVTGSMSDTTSDGVTKIAGLKQAVKDFYTALGPGSPSTGRIRYGFVPYSSSVNVGYLLPQTALVGGVANDTWQYQSREPVFIDVYTPATFSTESAASSGTTTYSILPSTFTNASVNLVVGSVTYLKELTGSTSPVVTSSGQCLAVSVPFSSLTLTGSPTTTLVSQTTPVYPATTITRNYAITQGYASNGTFYRYNWSSGRCRLQSGRVSSSGVRTIRYSTTQTVTSWTSVRTFDSWVYKQRDIDVTDYITGNAVPNPAYDAASPNDTAGNAMPATTTWAGCIEETESTNTITASSSLSIPSDAWDVKIDHVPSASIPESRWRPLWPDVEFWRYTDSSLSNYTTSDSDFGKGLSAFTAAGFGACPARARKLNSYATLSSSPTGDSSLSNFSAYVDSLTPIGGTYHDIGMVWGARLLSPDGLFGSENTTAPNGFPINRHIVFMSDGAMSTSKDNYDSWGMNFWDGRISPTSDDNATLTAAHNKRFEMICQAAKAKGYTIWVIGFGISALTPQMSACASDGDHASLSNSSSSLSQRFQTIAQSIGGLRLSQ